MLPPCGTNALSAPLLPLQSTFVLPYVHPDGHVTYIYGGDCWNANGPGGLKNSTCKLRRGERTGKERALLLYARQSFLFLQGRTHFYHWQYSTLHHIHL